MQRSTRRTISWLGIGVLVIGLCAGYTRLPGAGGTLAELRWLVDQPDFYVRHCNHAGLLIRQAEQQEPGVSARMFSALLTDTDRQHAGHTLMLLADQLILQRRENGKPNAALQSVFEAWFSRTSVEEKIALGGSALLCAGRAWARSEYPKLDDLPITKDDHRWLVAGTLNRERDTSFEARLLAFDFAWPSLGIERRLSFIDHSDVPWVEHPSTYPVFEDVVPFTRIDAQALSEQLRLGVDEIVAMLSDPIPQVRWAAGRILTVAGDERGLPAFCEWLDTNPKVFGLEQLMSDLFGPDWRKHCESSGAARP